LLLALLLGIGSCAAHEWFAARQRNKCLLAIRDACGADMINAYAIMNAYAPQDAGVSKMGRLTTRSYGVAVPDAWPPDVYTLMAAMNDKALAIATSKGEIFDAFTFMFEQSQYDDEPAAPWRLVLYGIRPDLTGDDLALIYWPTDDIPWDSARAVGHQTGWYYEIFRPAYGRTLFLGECRDGQSA
jgi:hypothetical protein